MKTAIVKLVQLVGLVAFLCAPPVALADTDVETQVTAASEAVQMVPSALPTLDAEPRYVPDSFYETGDKTSCVVWYDCCTFKCPPDYAPEIPEEKGDPAERKPHKLNRSRQSTA